jgi:hypothetical protein
MHTRANTVLEKEENRVVFCPPSTPCPSSHFPFQTKKSRKTSNFSFSLQKTKRPWRVLSRQHVRALEAKPLANRYETSFDSSEELWGGYVLGEWVASPFWFTRKRSNGPVKRHCVFSGKPRLETPVSPAFSFIVLLLLSLSLPIHYLNEDSWLLRYVLRRRPSSSSWSTLFFCGKEAVAPVGAPKTPSFGCQRGPPVPFLRSWFLVTGNLESRIVGFFFNFFFFVASHLFFSLSCLTYSLQHDHDNRLPASPPQQLEV